MELTKLVQSIIFVVVPSPSSKAYLPNQRGPHVFSVALSGDEVSRAAFS